MNTDDYINYLRECIENYLLLLESMLGPRDTRFVIGKIGVSENDHPMTFFPDKFHFGGGCRVDILITEWVWEEQDMDAGPWQVAHECVHLLDPCQWNQSTVLEEGLAVWFQNDPRHHHNEKIGEFASLQSKLVLATDRQYYDAMNIVGQYISKGLLEAVKEARQSGVRICDIHVDMLGDFLPDIERSEIQRLCSPFNQVV